MIKWFVIGFVSLFVVQAAAEECLYKPPAVIDLPYREGSYIPVYFSRYQFNLPSKPAMFLSGDGFIASYPERGYIGHQPVDVKPWHGGMPEGNLPESVADAYRILYGALPTEHLDEEAMAQVRFQREINKLDCHARVSLYRVGGVVDVIWQEQKSKDGFHTIWVMDAKRAELISISGSSETVMKVIASIKQRR